jgi:hypothetical protein
VVCLLVRLLVNEAITTIEDENESNRGRRRNILRNTGGGAYRREDIRPRLSPREYWALTPTNARNKYESRRSSERYRESRRKRGRSRKVMEQMMETEEMFGDSARDEVECTFLNLDEETRRKLTEIAYEQMK